MRHCCICMLDYDILNEIVDEKLLLRYVTEGADIQTAVSEVVMLTREQLISTFKWANELLRKEGIRAGFERFIEFANILFLKLISEIENDRESRGEERMLELKYCWESFSNLQPETMLEYINGTVLPHLVSTYNKSGDVFQLKLGIKNPSTLKHITDRLSDLTLINIESDVKGDAFEYFIKNAVTVGNDLGEYFTPRHIVRLMVKITNPQFGEKIYDPTCGTGGFLIDAFTHIKHMCKPTKNNMKILKKETVFGRELTNTARIAKMNMIITGDVHTNIQQMDSLEKPIKSRFDVVLANPPYGQTTDWGDLYPVYSKQADPIFIQHILLSLNENGRSAFIVPEGFLFRSGSDKKTRKYLLENYHLEAVISLPPGVFNPYTASKTNILYVGEGVTKDVWFFNVENDGFDLGATRKPIKENDIPELVLNWYNKEESSKSWRVSMDEIINNGYNLTANRYNPHPVSIEVYPDINETINTLIERQQEIIQKLDDVRGAL